MPADSMNLSGYLCLFLFEKSAQSRLQQVPFGRPCLALPHGQDSPTFPSQFPSDALVPRCVSLQIGDPITPIRRRDATLPAMVHVPETTADDVMVSRDAQGFRSGAR